MSKHKWININFGDLLNQRKDFTILEEGTEYPIYGVMKEGAGLLQKESVTSETTKFSKLLRLEKDNFVYRQITAFEAPSTVVLDDGAGGYVTPNTFPVFEIDTDRIMPGYLHLITQWGVFHREMAIRCAGTVLRRKTLSPKRLKEIPLLLPPVQAQREILAFMQSLDAIIQASDHEISRADQMREDVLRTLMADENDKWAEKPLMDVVNLQNGYAFKPKDLGNTGKPVVRIKQLFDPTATVDHSDIDIPEKFWITTGDIIFTWSARIDVAIWDRGDAYLNQHLFKVTTRDESVLSQDFTYMVIAEMIPRLTSHGTTMKHVTKTELNRQLVYIPPLEEQEKIVEKMQTLDAYLESAKRSQEALKQVRQDALHALLSGDKDVRELAEMFATDEDVA